jgi:putative two-component system protein, hydrogenase maturation factor HypX/HoxX
MAFRIALVYSGFGGIAQALWAGLRDDGHEVVRPENPGFEPPLSPDNMPRFAELAGPDVIFCPFLKEVVPPTVCERWTTWIPHPGIRGDGGPSSLPWAILEGEATWGLTMVRAEPSVEASDLDSGNVGAWRELPVPPEVTVGELYAQQVTPAALACTREVLDRMRLDPGYVGVPLAGFGDEVRGRFRPALSQAALAFSWEDHPEDIARRIRAATFGVRTELAGQPVNVFDAHPHDGDGTSFRPGAVVAHRDGAVLVGAGKGGALWIGHAKVRKDAGGRGSSCPPSPPSADCLPACASAHCTPTGAGRPRTHQVIRYLRAGDVGWIHATPFNGVLDHVLRAPARCAGLRGGAGHERDRPRRRPGGVE